VGKSIWKPSMNWLLVFVPVSFLINYVPVDAVGGLGP